MKKSKQAIAVILMMPLFGSFAQDGCQESLYKITGIFSSPEQKLAYLNKPAKKYNYNIKNHYFLEKELMDELSLAVKSKSLDAFIEKLTQGKFNEEGNYGNTIISVFDLVFMSDVPTKELKKLIKHGYYPTMFVYNHLANVPVYRVITVNEKLQAIEQHISLDLTYSASFEDRQVNLATLAFIKQSFFMLDYLLELGLEVQPYLLKSNEVLRFNKQYIQLQKQGKLASFAALKDSLDRYEGKPYVEPPDEIVHLQHDIDYPYFRLEQVLDCNVNKHSIIDMPTQKEIDKNLSKVALNNNAEINELDHVNPIYTELLIDRKKLLSNEYIIDETLIVDLMKEPALFVEEFEKANYNLATNVFRPKRNKANVTIIEYLLLFQHNSVSPQILEYLFTNKFEYRTNTMGMVFFRNGINKMLLLLEKSKFDFSTTMRGDTLSNMAVHKADLEMADIFFSKGSPLQIKYGMDALNFILRFADFDKNKDRLKFLEKRKFVLSKAHFELITSLSKYENAKFKQLMKIAPSFKRQYLEFKQKSDLKGKVAVNN